MVITVGPIKLSLGALLQIFFPLLPGVESIWEPAVEEVEEAIQNLRGGIDEGMDVFKDAAEDVQKEVGCVLRAGFRQLIVSV